MSSGHVYSDWQPNTGYTDPGIRCKNAKKQTKNTTATRSDLDNITDTNPSPDNLKSKEADSISASADN